MPISKWESGGVEIVLSISKVKNWMELWRGVGIQIQSMQVGVDIEAEGVEGAQEERRKDDRLVPVGGSRVVGRLGGFWGG